ncbi:MAG: response regulator, partial [Longimicrobiales bacterium]
VETFRSLNYEVDLLLTDVVMPGMDGWELAAVIEESAPHIPVLFMSGFVQDLEMNARFMENPEMILEKPFARENLLDRVSSLITAARTARD